MSEDESSEEEEASEVEDDDAEEEDEELPTPTPKQDINVAEDAAKVLQPKNGEEELVEGACDGEVEQEGEADEGEEDSEVSLGSDSDEEVGVTISRYRSEKANRCSLWFRNFTRESMTKLVSNRSMCGVQQCRQRNGLLSIKYTTAFEVLNMWFTCRSAGCTTRELFGSSFFCSRIGARRVGTVSVQTGYATYSYEAALDIISNNVRFTLIVSRETFATSGVTGHFR